MGEEEIINKQTNRNVERETKSELKRDEPRFERKDLGRRRTERTVVAEGERRRHGSVNERIGEDKAEVVKR